MQREAVQRTNGRRTPTDAPLVALLTGVILTTLIVVQLLQSPSTRDFGLSFMPSAKAWLTTGNPYDSSIGLVNLNPPSVTVLFLPFALMPLRIAAFVWTLMGAGFLAVTWTVAAKRIPLSRSVSIGSLGVLLCTVGASGIIWLEGQFTWALVFVVTMGWLHFRDNRDVQAGLYLGAAIAAKPFLAIGALALGLPILLVAATTSITITIIGIVVAGWPIWQRWLLGSSTVDWIGRPGNVSFWGLAARWYTPVLSAPMTLAGLGPRVALAVAGLGLGALILTRRRRDLDERWTLAMLTSILVSPLGWTHYLPIVAAPLAAVWATGRWTRTLTVAVALMCIPPSLGYSRLVGVSWIAGMTIGSLYNLAAILLWVDLAGRRAVGDINGDRGQR
jgi:hypothetical protein